MPLSVSSSVIGFLGHVSTSQFTAKKIVQRTQLTGKLALWNLSLRMIDPLQALLQSSIVPSTSMIHTKLPMGVVCISALQDLCELR